MWNNRSYKIWIDEAGRGPWLGHVVAAAVSFNPEKTPSGEFIQSLNDSKKLSEKKRDELYAQLIEMSRWENPQIFFGMWVVDNFVIDEINIRQANREAMRRSLVELIRKLKAHPQSDAVKEGKESLIKSVVIDGRDNYKFEELDKQPIYIVWGDGKIPEIGAASILAKVFRDKLMHQYATLYPDFQLENHKWYGTKKHKDYLSDAWKVTGIHRLSYKPVKKVLEKKPKLLLHICCWPDATVPIMDLKKDYEVVCFWYDPNIQPKKEHDKRVDEFIKVADIEWVDYIIGEYDVLNFFDEIKWLEDTPEQWDKCTKCYDMRLRRSALEARKLGINTWTSTLNTSPHKDLVKMFRLWDEHSEKASVISNWSELKEKLDFLKIAFRKNGGFQRSVDYTKKHDIYRQNYCGCIYSDTYPGWRRPAPTKK